MPTTPGADLLANLRERDAQELAEYGYDMAMAAAIIRNIPHVAFELFSHGGRQAAAVWFDALTPRALVVSMLATDEFPHVARQVIRWGLSVRPKLLAAGYRRAECRVMDGHSDAIRFLEYLGFRLECRLPQFGASGISFAQYAWRLNDHRVYFPQSSQDSSSPSNPTT